VTYQVFVERPRDPAPSAVQALANAIAARYGLPASALVQRLSGGRLRVKAGVDLVTARELASDLERLGAICSLVDEAGAPVAAAAPPAAPPAPTASASRSPPAPTASASRSLTPAPTASASRSLTPVPGQFASGLAAAFGGGGDADQDLGALGDASASFKLSTLDGDDGEARVDVRPPGPIAAPRQPTPPPVRGAPPPAAAPAPAFAPPSFAPPEEEGDLELAPVESVRPATQRMAPVPATQRLTPVPDEPPPATARLRPSYADEIAAMSTAPAAPPARSTVQTVRRLLAENDRVRFAVGLLLCAALAFIPAHLVAVVREGTAFSEIDARVRTEQAKVRTAEDWDALDEYRAGQLDLKATRRRNIAISSLLLWAAASAGLGFVWFRKIAWDRLAPPPA
jgi:hypothetical protein